MIPSFSMFSRPNQKTFIPFFPTYFLESYILHIRIIPCPFTSSVLGHPIHPSFSLSLEKARTNEWMCTKNRGWRKRKKGREESGRGRRDSRLNQRAKYKKGRRWKIEGNEALCEKAAVAARYRSFASHSTLRIRDIMLEC